MDLSYPQSIFRATTQAAMPEEIPSQMWVPEGVQLPRVSRVDQFLNNARQRIAARQAAKAAVEGRRREQQQQGVVAYRPSQPAIVDDRMRTLLTQSRLPQPASFENPVTTVQQRPTGGVIANYASGERAIKGQYGSGSATMPVNKPAMTVTEDGKTVSGAKWFQDAAARQGAGNNYADAVPVNKGWGIFRGTPKKKEA